MTEKATRVQEVTAEDFDRVVLGAPGDVTVVVEFYASWCPRCRMLTPILQRVVPSYGERALLAMVNVDAQPALGYRFVIEGVPTVKIFRGGQMIDEFIGAVPEEHVRRRLASLISASPAGPTPEDEELLRKESKAAAEKRLREAIKADPSDAAALLDLGRFLSHRGETAEAREVLSGVPYDSSVYLQAQAVIAELRLYEWCREIGGLDRAEERLARYAGDLEARFGRGCCLAAEGHHREGLQDLLAVLKTDRSFRGGAARDAMVSVFLVIGQHSELAEEYRRKALSS